MANVRRMVSRTVRSLAPAIPPLNAALSVLDEYRRDGVALLQQLKSVGEENAILRADNNRLHHENAQMRVFRYASTRYMWQWRALQAEHFGPPNPCPVPPKEIPPELMPGFSMNGRAEIEYNYLDCTYPANYPLIYTDKEINEYIFIISQNLKRPENERVQHWFIYGSSISGSVTPLPNTRSAANRWSTWVR